MHRNRGRWVPARSSLMWRRTASWSSGQPVALSGSPGSHTRCFEVKKDVPCPRNHPGCPDDSRLHGRPERAAVPSAPIPPIHVSVGRAALWALTWAEGGGSPQTAGWERAVSPFPSDLDLEGCPRARRALWLAAPADCCPCSAASS